MLTVMSRGASGHGPARRLCSAFEATNRDYRVVIAADAVDSMDGEEMHCFALRLMAATVGWVLADHEIIAALREQPTGR
jgi:nicotinamidase-related amidase